MKYYDSWFLRFRKTRKRGDKECCGDSEQKLYLQEPLLECRYPYSYSQLLVICPSVWYLPSCDISLNNNTLGSESVQIVIHVKGPGNGTSTDTGIPQCKVNGKEFNMITFNSKWLYSESPYFVFNSKILFSVIFRLM